MEKTIKLNEEYARSIWAKMEQFNDSARSILSDLENKTEICYSEGMDGQYANKFRLYEKSCITDFMNNAIDLYDLGRNLQQAAQEILHVDLCQAKAIDDTICSSKAHNQI